MTDERKYLRFPLSYRIEHWVSMGSFTVLAITGLVQKFATAGVSITIVSLLGGIESVRVIHRAAAIVLMLEIVYHLGAVGYRTFVKRSRPVMIPQWLDVRNAWRTLLYYFGREKSPPQQGRYTFEEKAEYWAFVWGTVIMAITGFMMWNPIATTRFLPGQAIPAAKAAHGNEALLAVLAIILWHMYHVHVRRFNRSMFTGYMDEEEMIEEHPLELADRKAGLAERPIDEQAEQRRRRLFLPAYGTIAAALLVGIFLFATFEQTAIETVPPPEGDIVVFAPFTPTPAPTEAPTAAPTEGALPGSWESGIDELFASRCGACHLGEAAFAGFDVSNPDSLVQGGLSGPALVPGEPDESLLMQRQVTGDHPGQFSESELEIIRDWIAGGAPGS